MSVRSLIKFTIHFSPYYCNCNNLMYKEEDSFGTGTSQVI